MTEKNIGNLLQRLRKQKGYTLRKVEELTGISNAYLSQLERGRSKRPSADLLQKLGEEYGVEKEELLIAAGYLKKSKTRLLDDPATVKLDGLTEKEADEVVDFANYLRSKRKTDRPYQDYTNPEVPIGLGAAPESRGFHEIKTVPVVGFAAEDKPRGQTEATVFTNGYISHEDGQTFHRSMEQLANLTLAKISPPIAPEKVFQFILLLEKSGHGRIWINNFRTMIRTRLKKAVEGGEPVHLDDVADILEVKFPDIPFDPDCGFVYFFSIKWRHALYFDLRPLASGEKIDEVELRKNLAAAHIDLRFRELFGNQATREKLLADGWFPYIWLLESRYRKLYEAYDRSLDIEYRVQEVLEEVYGEIPDRVETWSSHPAFKKHEEILQRAAERLKDRDYISAIGNTWTRIEGLLREICTKKKKKVSDDYLIRFLENRTADKVNRFSLFFPREFKSFLRSFYFRNFDLESGKTEVSRHSCAHGVAQASDYTLQRAIQGFLILDQIYYYLSLK